jgi:hypothetical protein
MSKNYYLAAGFLMTIISAFISMSFEEHGVVDPSFHWFISYMSGILSGVFSTKGVG